MRASRKAALAAAAVLLLGLAGCSDSDLSVPGPETDEAAEVVKELERAADAQDICYGWHLGGRSTDPASVGSNLGAGVPVDSDPTRCPRWMEVSASVYYVPDSSESEDSAVVNVRTSPGLPGGTSIEVYLDRFGLDEQAFIDDPAWSAARAALALPLLAAEADVVEPVPTPSAAPAAAPSPLPDAGSDFWRDRLGMVIAAAVLLLIAAGFAAIGVIAGRRQRTTVTRKR